MTTKRWAKTTRKRCTKKEEKEVLEHLRKTRQYRAWLETCPQSDERDAWIENCDTVSEKWKARYKELVGR